MQGTSRLVSTDSEEPPSSSPAHYNQQLAAEPEPADRGADETVPPASTPKIIVKPLRPPDSAEGSAAAAALAAGAATAADSNEDEEDEEEEEEEEEEEPPEINYCTVKISPDKPPKERLKLIIKTDVIRNAIAKAAAAAESRSEKKSKSKKHKHKQLLAAAAAAAAGGSSAPGTGASTPAEISSEFKTPSPHLALSEAQQAHTQPHPHHHHHLHPQRGSAVISPTTRSDHDFDSQSSVLGSISSKGNSTPQLLAQAVQEDSCVIRSRGSSVITSDLETSQHSSLVAPPSDIESRLESMMMTIDGTGTGTGAAAAASETPLQEDILAVLRGEVPRLNGSTEAAANEEEQQEQQPPKRATRGRGRKANNNVEVPPPATETRTRGRAKGAEAAAISPPTPKRSTRGTRGSKKAEATTEADMEVDEPPAAAANEEQVDQAAVPAPPRRGRNAAARANNNNSASINNNINKIAASLSAKAKDKDEASRLADGSGAAPTRSYGRKRKNQQVTQAQVPPDEQQQQQQAAPEQEEEAPEGDEEEQPTPAKIPHRDHSPTDHDPDPDPDEMSNNSNNSSLQHDGSSSSPPPRDFKFKDKFKRTLTLDTQVAANAAGAAAAAAAAAAGEAGATAGATGAAAETEPYSEQRGAVKLVISKKKGSIFKSRALVASDQAEHATVAKRHLYKHSWDAALEANGGGTGSDASNASASGAGVPGAKDHLLLHHLAAGKSDGDFGDSPSSNNNGSSSGGSSVSTLRGDSPALGKISRLAGKQGVPTGTAAGVDAFDLDLETGAEELGVERSTASSAVGGTGLAAAGAGGAAGGGPIRVDRKTKDYYTVVRNVKTAHQIQEIGEYQEMDDDVEYILDALQPHNPPATRCLSALQLAAKCMMPAFRMHVRAHGVVTKFFKVSFLRI